MLEKAFQILKEYVKSGDTVIVGVSGGPDSTALLDILISYNLQPTSYKLIIVHINHGIRGAEADRDEKFVRELAKSYDCRCEVKRVRLAGKSGLEERGRKIRREFFEKLHKKYRAKWILTAHTEDDQLETIVFNFLRGSGPAGLAGMKMIDGVYFKPLLGISKAEILTYLTSKKLKFCHDKTNNNTYFRRNFIRKKILPLFEKINPSFRKTILRNSEIFGIIEQWFDDSATQFLNRQANAKRLFPRSDFRKLPKALQLAIIQKSYRRGQKSIYALPFSKVEEVRYMIEKGVENKKIECPGGWMFLLQKGNITFSLHRKNGRF